MSLKIARRGQIAPFIVMDVMRQADRRMALGQDVLHLELGQPSTPALAGVRAAAHAALDADRLGYTQALGLPALRDRIARHYRGQYGVAVEAERVVVTVGSSGAFLLAFLAAFDAGDRVALAAPGYPAYRNILTALDVEVVELPTDRAARYQPTIEVLTALDRPIDGLIVASPANPTGAVLSTTELASLAGYCRARSIRLVSDEIYHGLTYGAPADTMLSADRSAIIVNSFSKYYAMTGWRLGWVVLPPDLVRPVECLAQNLFISPPTLSQLAALAAFECGEELEANRARYAEHRALLLDALPGAGFADFVAPDGGFYVYAAIDGRSDDSEAFCRRMLAETGVAITPGIDFDPRRGRHTVRFSFSGARTDIEEAMRRLSSWR